MRGGGRPSRIAIIATSLMLAAPACTSGGARDGTGSGDQPGASARDADVAAAGDALTPMVLDGAFHDWAMFAPLVSDETGDSPAGEPDLGRLWVTDRDGALWLRLEVGREVNLQHADRDRAGAEATLYIDGDGEPRTGLPVGGIGADLAVQFGRLRVLRFGPDGFDEVSLNDLAIGVMPTHTSDSFEIRIPLASVRAGGSGAGLPQLDTARRTTGTWIGLVLRTAGGDRLPDAGHAAYEITDASDPAPPPVPFARLDAGHVRVLVHNTERNGTIERPEPFERYLRAVDPDIVAFQEAWEWSAERAVEFMERLLPATEKGRWYGAQQEDVVTLARWPIAASAPVDGNLVVRIDTPDEVGPRDLVLFNVHTPCCDRDADRDAEHQQIAATWRDLLRGRGPFEIDPRAPVIMAGDFNMVGYEHQLSAVRDGTILAPERYGESFSPGRENGSLVAVPSAHTHTRETFTWRDDGQAFLPGRLDWILFSDDAARLGRHFVLWTPEVPPDVLDSFGLRADDSPRASDHLVMVADFDLH